MEKFWLNLKSCFSNYNDANISSSSGGSNSININNTKNQSLTNQECTSVVINDSIVNDHELVQYASIDDFLKNWVGEFGKAQVLQFTLTSFAWALEALHTLVTVFADKTPQWQCLPHSSSHGNNMMEMMYNQNGSSHSGSGLGSVCTPASSICAMDPRVWEWVNKAESTVSQWNLICEKSYKQSLMQSAFFIGMLLGSGIFGSLSDSRHGRKGALATASFCSVISSLLTAASPNYATYVLLRTMTGICCGGLGLTSFVLITESIGPSHRSTVSISSLYFYPLGMMLLSGLAFMAQGLSWRYLYLITSTPSIVYCLFILPFLVESPRYYLVQGRIREALGVLRTIAKKNGTVIPVGVVLTMENDIDIDNGGDRLDPKDELELEVLKSEPKSKWHGVHQHHKTKGALMDVLRGSETRLRVMIIMVVWFVCAVGYFSLNLNVGNLGSNLSMIMLMNALAEVPSSAVVAFLSNKVGRRITLMLAMLLCSLSCLLTVVVSYRVEQMTRLRSYIQQGANLVSLFAISGTDNLLHLYTAELFPTVVRNGVLGLTSQAAFVGSIIAPFSVLSAQVNFGLPFLIIGSMALVGAALAMKLPETMNQKLHETLEGMERCQFK